MLRSMSKICSIHHQRNERVRFFNLSPREFIAYKAKTNLTVYKYRGQEIPIISVGWKKYGDLEVKEVESREGNFNVILMTYELD